MRVKNYTWWYIKIKPMTLETYTKKCRKLHLKLSTLPTYSNGWNRGVAHCRKVLGLCYFSPLSGRDSLVPLELACKGDTLPVAANITWNLYQMKCLYIKWICGETYQIKCLCIKCIGGETYQMIMSIHKMNLQWNLPDEMFIHKVNLQWNLPDEMSIHKADLWWNLPDEMSIHKANLWWNLPDEMSIHKVNLQWNLPDEMFIHKANLYHIR